MGKCLLKVVSLFLELVSNIRLGFPADPSEVLDRLMGRKISDKPAFAQQESAKIFVMIPFRDQSELTKKCLASVLAQKLRETFELKVVLINNQSKDGATLNWLKSAQQDSRVIVVDYDRPFNFSAMHNETLAALAADPRDRLCFLNNDVELTDPHTLDELAEFVGAEEHRGAVGCTLIYPDKRIQHIFAAAGVKIVAAHPLKGRPLDLGDRWFSAYAREVGAVTGALLMLRTNTFLKVGMFDENLPTLGQDIDLCLKINKNGQSVWSLPNLVAIHRESTSKGGTFNWDEVRYIYDKWGEELTKNTSYPRQLSRWSERPTLTMGEGRYPWFYLRRCFSVR